MVRLLFYYSQTTTGNLQNLNGIVTRAANAEEIQVGITRTSLFPKLKAYSSICDLAVLVAITPDELDGFYQVRDMLWHMDTILIVPDNNNSTLYRGSLLFPRLIISMESNFHHIESILKKMIQRSHRRKLETNFFL